MSAVDSLVRCWVAEIVAVMNQVFPGCVVRASEHLTFDACRDDLVLGVADALTVDEIDSALALIDVGRLDLSTRLYEDRVLRAAMRRALRRLDEAGVFSRVGPAGGVPSHELWGRL